MTGCQRDPEIVIGLGFAANHFYGPVSHFDRGNGQARRALPAVFVRRAAKLCQSSTETLTRLIAGRGYRARRCWAWWREIAGRAHKIGIRTEVRESKTSHLTIKIPERESKRGNCFRGLGFED
jgi:hypothetical protein